MLGFLVGFRKWILVVLFFSVTLSLLFMDRIGGEFFINANRDLFVAFIGSNVGEHLINFGKEWLATKDRSKIAELIRTVSKEK